MCFHVVKIVGCLWLISNRTSVFNPVHRGHRILAFSHSSDSSHSPPSLCDIRTISPMKSLDPIFLDHRAQFSGAVVWRSCLYSALSSSINSLTETICLSKQFPRLKPSRYSCPVPTFIYWQTRAICIIRAEESRVECLASLTSNYKEDVHSSQGRQAESTGQHSSS
jgi:hypothetical protein